VDFDPSDDDVDPDPITATDTINTFAQNKGLTDTATASDSDAKSLTRPNVTDAATMADSDAKSVSKPFSDTLTAVEGIKLNPALGKTDTATATDTITKFDPRLGKTDSATATDAVNTFAQNKALADTVSITDVAVKNFTENVDYDRNDADADADPVTMADSPAWATTKVLTDSISGADVIVFSGAKVFTDAVTASESIYTLLTLGESSYLYPDYVVMSDGENPFLQLTFEPFTGVIGGPGYVNQVIVNADSITYPDQSGAGLVVNFYYTDVSDRTVGGYMFNQTPIL
jgi:hypothetical protein